MTTSTSMPQYVQSTIDPEIKLSENKRREWRTLTETELSQDADGVITFLARYTVERNHPRSTDARIPDILKSGEVLVCTPECKLPSVFGQLCAEGFLSNPVVIPTSQDKKDVKGVYKGWIDLLDIVSQILSLFGDYRESLKDLTDESRTKQMIDFSKTDAFTKSTVKDLMQKHANKDYPPPVHKGYSLLYCIERMVRSDNVRLPICTPVSSENTNDKIVRGLISDSMVMSLLDQNLDKLGHIRQTKVKRMLPGLVAKQDIITVHVDDLAVKAFQLMQQHKVKGIPIVDKDQTLVDVIAVRDCRLLGDKLQNISRLFLKVSEFKALERKEFARQTPPAPIYVTENDTFGHVINSTDDGNIHRIFVCSEETTSDGKVAPKLKSLISQRDCMRFLLWRCGFSSATFESTVEDINGQKMKD